MIFEWDENKNKSNQKKHGVSFEVAMLAFNDPNILTWLDNRYDYGEERWISIGLATERLLLQVAHVVEEDKNGEEIIRIISARKGHSRDWRRYLQGLP